MAREPFELRLERVEAREICRSSSKLLPPPRRCRCGSAYEGSASARRFLAEFPPSPCSEHRLATTSEALRNAEAIFGWVSSDPLGALLRASLCCGLQDWFDFVIGQAGNNGGDIHTDWDARLT